LLDTFEIRLFGNRAKEKVVQQR